MLAKINRIIKEKDFEEIFRRGKSVYNLNFGTKYVINKLNYNRLGISISKKVSKKAVDRNLIKRRVKVILRPFILKKINPGHDLLIMVLPNVLGKSYKEMERSLVSNLQKLRLLV